MYLVVRIHVFNILGYEAPMEHPIRFQPVLQCTHNDACRACSPAPGSQINSHNYVFDMLYVNMDAPRTMKRSTISSLAMPPLFFLIVVLVPTQVVRANLEGLCTCSIISVPWKREKQELIVLWLMCRRHSLCL